LLARVGAVVDPERVRDLVDSVRTRPFAGAPESTTMRLAFASQ
jgi:hypothetical protein